MTAAGPGLPKRGKRHLLLLQQRLAAMLFWPALLIAAASVSLLVWGPAELAPARLLLVVLAVGGGLIAALTQWLSLSAYVRCEPQGLRLHLPFREFVIPYGEIQSTRLAELGREFPPESEPWSRRQFLEPLAATTLVVVHLRELPDTRRRLRLWLSPYMLSPTMPGLLLPVRDWLTLRSELDEFRARTGRSI